MADTGGRERTCLVDLLPSREVGGERRGERGEIGLPRRARGRDDCARKWPRHIQRSAGWPNRRRFMMNSTMPMPREASAGRFAESVRLARTMRAASYDLGSRRIVASEPEGARRAGRVSAPGRPPHARVTRSRSSRRCGAAADRLVRHAITRETNGDSDRYGTAVCANAVPVVRRPCGCQSPHCPVSIDAHHTKPCCRVAIGIFPPRRKACLCRSWRGLFRPSRRRDAFRDLVAPKLVACATPFGATDRACASMPVSSTREHWRWRSRRFPARARTRYPPKPRGTRTPPGEREPPRG